MLKGKKGVAVLERVDQPLAVDLPLMREIRATVAKCLENGRDKKHRPYPELAAYSSLKDLPAVFGFLRPGQPRPAAGGHRRRGREHAAGRCATNGMFYLSIDFVRKTALTPKQEIYQQTVTDAYPHVADLAIKGSENPNLMPKDSITVRMHSIGGWGAITTGKNLAMTLFDLLGYHVKANPKYGSEKKGQPTTYYLAAAPEPIRINCEYFYVDVVLSPDPNVFHHTNAVAGLKQGGVLVMQSDADSPERVLGAISPALPARSSSTRTFACSTWMPSTSRATRPPIRSCSCACRALPSRVHFSPTSPLLEKHGLTEAQLLAAIRRTAAAQVRLQGRAGGRRQHAGGAARL